MTRREYILAASAAAAAIVLIFMRGGHPAAPVASGGDSAAPAAQVIAATSGDGVLPAEFALLETQSPFGRGGMTGSAAHGGPEASLIFRGAVQTPRGITAFIENMATKNVVQLMAGESIGRGKIKTIDLDAMEYESAGKSRRIELGRNLNGEAPPPLPAPPATTAPSPSASPPQNAAPRQRRRTG